MTTTRADCEALDRSDVLAVKRGAFLLPKGVIYLDGNSLGVLPRNVPARVAAAVEREWGETLIKSWNEHGWFHLPQKIGRRLERLIGAEPGSHEIVRVYRWALWLNAKLRGEIVLALAEARRCFARGHQRIRNTHAHRLYPSDWATFLVTLPQELHAGEGLANRGRPNNHR